MTGALTYEQVSQLLRPINPRRVSKMDNLSHLEAYDVRAHLNRLFGFAGWSEETTDLTMLYEQSKEEKDSTRWRAAYRATVRLTIHVTGAVYTESAVGTNFGWLPDSKRDEAHDMAIKTAASQALKRCAINLGDQFGLSLYQKGSTGALVGRTLILPPPTPQQDAPHRPSDESVDSHVTEVAPETPAPQVEPSTATSTPPDAPAGQDPDNQYTDIIRERILTEATTKTGTARKIFLTKQLAEIGRRGLATAPVTRADGSGVSLEKLCMDAIRADEVTA